MSNLTRRRAMMAPAGVLPPEYQQVEYIQTVQNSANRYTNSINTLLQYKDVKRAVFKLKYLNTVATNRGYMCCAAYNSQTSRGSPFFCFAANGLYYDGFNSINCIPPYNITQAYNTIIEPDVTFSTQDTHSIAFPSWMDFEWSIDCEIYYAMFYGENDELLRDYVPCYRKSDNEPGMYDTVNNVFYTNAGPGTFVVGNNV